MYVATFDFASPTGLSRGGAGPAVFPRAIIAITALLAVISLIKTFLDKSEERISLSGAPYRYRSVGLLLGLFLVYVLALPLVGFIASTVAFMFIAQVILTGAKRKKTLLINITVAVVSTILVYFVFTNALNIILP